MRQIKIETIADVAAKLTHDLGFSVSLHGTDNGGHTRSILKEGVISCAAVAVRTESKNYRAFRKSCVSVYPSWLMLSKFCIKAAKTLESCRKRIDVKESLVQNKILHPHFQKYNFLLLLNKNLCLFLHYYCLNKAS